MITSILYPQFLLHRLQLALGCRPDREEREGGEGEEQREEQGEKEEAIEGSTVPDHPSLLK